MDLFVDASHAFNQAGLIIGGLLCLLIGGFILFDTLYWQIKGVSVKATIKAVRGISMYYPVFEYTSSAGEVVQAEATGGSSSLLDKIPGQQATISVMPDQPRRASRRGWVWPLVGLFFTSVAIVLFAVAFSNYKTSLLLIPMLIALAVGYFIKNVTVKGAPKAKKQMRDGTPETRLLAQREKVKILTEAEIKEKLQKVQETQGNWQVPVLILLALGCIGFSVFEGNRIAYLHAVGARTAGEVVATGSRQSRMGEAYTYYAIAEFTDVTGQTYRFDDSFSQSGSAPFRRGEQVTVIYDPQDPQKAIIDRGWMNWAVSGGALAFGLFMLYAAYSTVRSRRKLAYYLATL